jgi:hypothetical protein
VKVRNFPLFRQPQSGRQSVVFVTSHESKRDFGAITLLFFIAPLSGVQLENNRVMLPKFHSDLLLVTNPCFVGHSWVGLGPILSYRHVGPWYLETCGTYDASLLNEFFDSRMVGDRGWMHGSWKNGGAHMKEWMNKNQEFIDRPCSRCSNVVCQD